jgi:hypothetical protein
MLGHPGVELRLPLDLEPQTAGKQRGSQVGSHCWDAVVDQLEMGLDLEQSFLQLFLQIPMLLNQVMAAVRFALGQVGLGE